MRPATKEENNKLLKVYEEMLKETVDEEDRIVISAIMDGIRLTIKFSKQEIDTRIEKYIDPQTRIVQSGWAKMMLAEEA